MPAKILVAYSTRLLEQYLPDVNDLTPPATHKHEEAIARWREEQKLKLTEVCRLQPYTGTFKEVFLVDPANKRRIRWTSDDRAPFNHAKQSVSLAVLEWLQTYYKDAWKNSLYVNEPPQVAFLGFDPALFLQMVGIECGLPAFYPDNYQKPDMSLLPLDAWQNLSNLNPYRNVRDIESMVMPGGGKYLTWKTVLNARGLATHPKLAKWTGPHHDAEADLLLATELAAQLGLLAEE